MGCVLFRRLEGVLEYLGCLFVEYGGLVVQLRCARVDGLVGVMQRSVVALTCGPFALPGGKVPFLLGAVHDLGA